MARGKKRGGGGRKRKKEKVEKTPEEMAYRLFHSRSSTPTTAIFLQVLPGETRDSWLVNAWKSRKNRPACRYSTARERDERVGGDEKVVCDR